MDPFTPIRVRWLRLPLPIRVRQCKRVDNDNGLAKHVLVAPLDVGATVEVTVDWERRQDHMSQHSAQHLVTALAIKHFRWETLSWNLGEDTSFLELATPEISAAELQTLEAESNAAIRAGHVVTPSWHSVTDVNEGAVPGLRKSSKPLPPSVTGPVRVVTYDGIDTNTCCGTHVATTAHLQATRLRRPLRFECCREASGAPPPRLPPPVPAAAADATHSPDDVAPK